MTPPNEVDQILTPSSHQDLLRSEQVRLLYNGLPAALVTNVLLSAMLVGVQWAELNPKEAIGWIILMATVLTFRLVNWVTHQQTESKQDKLTTAWLTRFRLGAIATGVIWGIAGVLFFPPADITHQVFLAFVLAGVSAGAIISLAVDRISSLGFVAPALLPITLSFILEGDAMPLAMGVMGLLFIIFAMASAARFERSIHKNVHLHSNALTQQRALENQQQLNAIITRAQSQFICEDDRRKAFDGLLSDILILTESEYGFIGEVLYTTTGIPYLKTFSVTNIAWDDSTHDFYETNVAQGLEFTNLKTLFGVAMTSGKPVISNNPAHDPRSGGLPKGHPPLNAFLGIPIYHGGKQMAMLGIANRPSGYDQALVALLQPLLVTIGQLISAAQFHQRLLESEDQYRKLFEFSKYGNVTLDEHAIIDCNQTTLSMFGFQAKREILGKSLDELSAFPRSDRGDSDGASILRVQQTGAADSNFLEWTFRRRNGEIFIAEVMLASITIGGRDLTLCTIHDITKRVEDEARLGETEMLNRLLLESVGEGIYGLDTDGNATFINPAACKMLGYNEQELVGHTLHELFQHLPLAGSSQSIKQYPLYTAYIEGTSHEVGTAVLWSKDGTEIPVEYINTPVKKDGQLVGAVIAFRDITERRENENALLIAKNEAEQANAAKSEFLSHMSHELRTPLNAILGFGQLLETDPDSPLNERQTDNVREILKAGHHLLELINEILDLAKIESGHIDLSLEPVEACQIIEESIHLMAGLAAERNINFVYSSVEDAVILADRIRLKQALLNLFSNAIKYNHDGGSININAHSGTEGQLCIQVEDTGIGISAKHIAELFQPFKRLKAEKSNIVGTGIGLTITKQIIEMMGGTVGVESKLGIGTCFSIELPLHLTTRQTDSVL